MGAVSPVLHALPGPVRRLGAAAWSEWVGYSVARELAALVRGTRPVIVGPWLGEVGFELLYWLPFLNWAVERFAIERSRLVVVSRGGTAGWYREISTRYRDVFEFMDEQEFRARNRARIDEIGEQKQLRPTRFDTDLGALVARAEGLDAAAMLHPSVMYRVFSPFWWRHRGPDWIDAHARFRALPRVDAVERPRDLPEHYVAVKFYFNDAFPATPDNRAWAVRTVRELGEQTAVVSLATGLRIDDHHPWADEQSGAVSMGAVDAQTNLGRQSAIIAGAQACVGTYGGFAYLPPLHRVPMWAFHSDEKGFSRTHLDLAQSVFARLGPGLLTVSPAGSNVAPLMSRSLRHRGEGFAVPQ